MHEDCAVYNERCITKTRESEILAKQQSKELAKRKRRSDKLAKQKLEVERGNLYGCFSEKSKPFGVNKDKRRTLCKPRTSNNDKRKKNTEDCKYFEGTGCRSSTYKAPSKSKGQLAVNTKCKLTVSDNKVECIRKEEEDLGYGKDGYDDEGCQAGARFRCRKQPMKAELTKCKLVGDKCKKKVPGDTGFLMENAEGCEPGKNYRCRKTGRKVGKKTKNTGNKVTVNDRQKGCYFEQWRNETNNISKSSCTGTKKHKDQNGEYIVDNGCSLIYEGPDDKQVCRRNKN